MENFAAEETLESFIFECSINKIIHFDIRIKVSIEDNFWRWNFYAGKERWNKIILRDGKFIQIRQPFEEFFTEEMQEEINKGFYELFNELKISPKYRLKLINTLNNKVMKVWETV